MARSTRRTTPRAPSRALRSRSLGAGTRNDNGPGSRASARAQNVGEVAAGGDAVNQDQNNNREDQAAADLETMRAEQACIQMEGRIPGYKSGDLLSPLEQKFHELLTKELKLSHDTADEVDVYAMVCAMVCE